MKYIENRRVTRAWKAIEEIQKNADKLKALRIRLEEVFEEEEDKHQENTNCKSHKFLIFKCIFPQTVFFLF